MQTNLKEILALALLETISTIEEGYVEKLLVSLKENETAEELAADLKAGYSFFNRIALLAAKTSTNVDDTLVGVFVSAIKDSAKTNGVSLE